MKKPARDGFNNDTIGLEWNMLRTPHSKWYRLEDGELVLKLRPETLDQLANPSLLARRIKHHEFSASLKLEFEASSPGESAGMILYRRSSCHYQFLKQEGALVVVKTEKGEKTEVARVRYDTDEVILKAEAHGLDLQFSYGKSEQDLQLLGGLEKFSLAL